MVTRRLPDKFLVAFAFAGKYRELVRAIADEVEKALGESNVFLDEWYEHYLAGDDADLKLQKIYGDQSVLVVVCVSEYYGGNSWTRAEHRAIRARRMRASAAGNSGGKFEILPIRVGDGDIDGIPFNTIVPDVRSKSVAEITTLIINRLRLITENFERNVKVAIRGVSSGTAVSELGDKPAKEPTQRQAKVIEKKQAREYDIFLSYSRKDIERARWFIDLFEREGFSVFWDLASIPPGITFHQFVRQALDSSSSVVVLWSEASVQSNWVDIEAREGHKRGILLPVLLEKLKEDQLPFGLHMIQATPLEDWNGKSSHRNLKLLLSTIHAKLGK